LFVRPFFGRYLVGSLPVQIYGIPSPFPRTGVSILRCGIFIAAPTGVIFTAVAGAGARCAL